eukprot:Phypoly_transcript_14271.p1 GENE.Phypoly_transcript_14271~~Phypoly_transcript_14271.p1  ORF type:complete len:242 (+),score=43.41 Phypoly_transcript_14271:183-908(+)
MEAQVVMDDSEKERRIQEFLPQIEKLLKLADDPGWKQMKSKKGYEVFWMRTDESPVVSVKGEGIVNAKVEDIFHFMQAFENANSIDPMFMEGRIALHLGNNHAINYAAYKMPPMITARDFVIHAYDAILENGVGVSVGKSIEVPELPHRHGFVRAAINNSGYVYKPLPEDPSKSFVQYVVNVDVKGWIPYWVVNMSAADQGANIKRLQDYFAKADNKDKKHKKEKGKEKEHKEEHKEEEHS